MTVSERRIWSTAVLASLGLHMALLWPGTVVLRAENVTKQDVATATRLSFRSLPRPSAPSSPTPPVSQPQRPPVLPQVEVPAPVAAAAVAAATPVVGAESAAVPVTQAEPVTAAASVPDPHLAEQLRQHYLGQVLAQIEARKFYPSTARRRGLQGVINVSFTLHDSGQISSIVVKGHEVLRQAAQEAVQAALPLPVPPSEVVCPLLVSFGMEFRLN